MTGVPGLDPVETQVSGGTDQDVNLVSVAGTAVNAAAAAEGKAPVSSLGGNTIATNQVSVLSSATQIVAARAAGRLGVIITTSGTDTIYVGVTGVTTGAGLMIPNIAGASIYIPTSAAVYGIATTTTTVVSYMEVY